MIEWILPRPPHASNPAEIRVAERLRGLVDSPHAWTVIWGYYYQDSRGMQREGDFLILGPAGGLLVLEVKSSLPRHFPETGRWEGAGGDDPISQLNTEWQGVINGIKAKGNPPYIAKALCVPGVEAPAEVENFQGIPRNWLVTGNDLDNWISTWLRLFGERVRNPVNPLEKRAVLEAFGQGSLPEEKRAFIDHTEQLFERQFTSRFALLDQLSENRQLLIHGGTGTGKTWHALELAFRHARQGDGQRVLFLTYNKALTAQLRRIVALRQIERGEVIVRGWEELFLELCSLAGKSVTPPPPGSPVETIRAFYEIASSSPPSSGGRSTTKASTCSVSDADRTRTPSFLASRNHAPPIPPPGIVMPRPARSSEVPKYSAACGQNPGRKRLLRASSWRVTNTSPGITFLNTASRNSWLMRFGAAAGLIPGCRSSATARPDASKNPAITFFQAERFLRRKENQRYETIRFTASRFRRSIRGSSA
jgi:hypothetical protein